LLLVYCKYGLSFDIGVWFEGFTIFNSNREGALLVSSRVRTLFSTKAHILYLYNGI